ncbi:hypothetical protein T4B_12580 [Trichinella pseudospiralis]|nr:hypothetical protein T4D_5769 [Trichinella pseudospiralis]KRZ22325.1 hypothetical protein T4B_12580 [Trichinella pseudospiralis]
MAQCCLFNRRFLMSHVYISFSGQASIGFAVLLVVGFNYLLLIYERRLVISSCSDLTAAAAAATGLAQ